MKNNHLMGITLSLILMVFAIIHIPTGTVEEYREADNSAIALAGFLEVLSYNPPDYEARDATGVNRQIRHRWDGALFVENPIVVPDELTAEQLWEVLRSKGVVSDADRPRGR